MVICFLMNGELAGMAPNCGERFPIMTKGVFWQPRSCIAGQEILT